VPPKSASVAGAEASQVTMATMMLMLIVIRLAVTDTEFCYTLVAE